MPTSNLDERIALIVVDLQQGLAHVQTVHPLRDVAVRAGELAEAFRTRGLPVVLVNVIGGGSTEFFPELRQHRGDHVVTKSGISAFHPGTRLTELLATLDVTQVVVAGVSTSKGVESTAQDAHTRGFRITIVRDAITDRMRSAHDHSLQHVFPGLGQIATVDDIIAALPAGMPPTAEESE
ncbi:isochorismatase family protein [soil metagenome]